MTEQNNGKFDGECDCRVCGTFCCTCCNHCPFGTHTPLCGRVCAEKHYAEKHPQVDVTKAKWGWL